MQFLGVSAKTAEDNFIIVLQLNMLQAFWGDLVIKRFVFAIKYFHKILGHPDPCNSELAMYV